MNDSLKFLVTVLYNGGLLRCAIKIPSLLLDQSADWQNPTNWPTLHRYLPRHVANCGPIVGVDESLFEVAVVD